VACPSKTALVTGARGFTGRHLRHTLQAAGWQVVGLIRESDPDPDEITVDLTIPKQLQSALAATQPDYVVHLAAITFVPHSNPAEIYQTNVLGTLNLLDAIVAVGLKPCKVLIASSANVYGNPLAEVLDETICPAPVNHYAASKLAMEHLVRTYQDQLPLLISRPFNYTGPGQDERFLIPKIVGHYQRRQPIIELGNLAVIRDFSDVRFVTEAYRKLLESDIVSETINLCSGQGVSLDEIINRMNLISGYEIEVRINPEFVRNNEVKRLIGDNHKLQRLVGPLHIFSIDEILRTLYGQGCSAPSSG